MYSSAPAPVMSQISRKPSLPEKVDTASALRLRRLTSIWNMLWAGRLKHINEAMAMA